MKQNGSVSPSLHSPSSSSVSSHVDSDVSSSSTEDPSPCAPSDAYAPASGAPGGPSDAKKSKGKKPKKSPSSKSAKPSRKKSAYLFFNKEFRVKLLRENPKLSFAEASKLIGKKWKELSKEEREPFEKKAQEEQERKELEKSMEVDVEKKDRKEKKEKKEKREKKEVKKTKAVTKKVKKKVDDPPAPSETSPHPGVASKSPRPMHTFLPVLEDPPKPAKPKESTPKKRMGMPYGIFLEKREKQLREEFRADHPSATELEVNSYLMQTYEDLPVDEREDYIAEAKKRTKGTKVVKRKNSNAVEEKPVKKQKVAVEEKGGKKPAPTPLVSELPHVPLPIVPAPPLAALPDNKKEIKVKRSGDKYFSRIFLQQNTKEELISKISEKLKDTRAITDIIHLPDVRVDDDEDVKCLGAGAALEVIFEEKS